MALKEDERITHGSTIDCPNKLKKDGFDLENIEFSKPILLFNLAPSVHIKVSCPAGFGYPIDGFRTGLDVNPLPPSSNTLHRRPG